MRALFVVYRAFGTMCSSKTAQIQLTARKVLQIIVETLVLSICSLILLGFHISQNAISRRSFLRMLQLVLIYSMTQWSQNDA